MSEEEGHMEQVFKKLDLGVEEFMNNFELDALSMLKDACYILESKTKAEEMIISSVFVKAYIMDDLRMIQKNLMSIKNAIKLKELRFDTMCLN